jgi:hypothetical protein
LEYATVFWHLFWPSDIFWVIWYIFAVLLHCTTKNLATLLRAVEWHAFFDRPPVRRLTGIEKRATQSEDLCTANIDFDGIRKSVFGGQFDADEEDL